MVNPTIPDATQEDLRGVGKNMSNIYEAVKDGTTIDSKIIASLIRIIATHQREVVKWHDGIIKKAK